jgi:hypothetical protein
MAFADIVLRNSGSAFDISFISGLSATVGQATETELAQAITVNPIRRLVGQITETSTVQAITSRKTVTVNQATETDAAQNVSHPHTISVGQVSETDSAQAVSVNPIRRLISQAVETPDTAQAITRIKTVSVGQAIETNLSQAITKIKTVYVPMVGKLDLGSISGLVVSSDASDASSITLSGSEVTQWNDTVGGHHFTQSISTNRPFSGTRTQNGLNVIDFDGIDNFLTEADNLNIATSTIVLVFQADAVADGMKIVDGYNAVGGGRNIIGVNGSSFAQWAGQFWNSAQGTNTNPHIAVAKFNGGNAQMWIDRTIGPIGNTGSNTLNGIKLGNEYSGAAQWFDGWIAQFAVFNRILTANEIRQVINGLNDKWAIYGASSGIHEYSETAQSVSKTKVKAIGQAIETDLSQSITSVKTKAVGQASETDLAQIITRVAPAIPVAQTTETDLAQVVSVNPVRRLVGQAIETDLSQGITKSIKVKVVGQATETDLAQPLTENPNNVYVSGVLETDTAQSISVNPIRRLVGQVSETDSSQSINRIKTKIIGTAQTITHDANSTTGTYSETTQTWSHVLGSGSNRILVLAVGGEYTTGAPTAPTSVTFNSVAMHLAVESAPQIGPNGSYAKSFLYYMDDTELPAAGTYNVSVTWNVNAGVNRWFAEATSVSDAAQGAPSITNSSTAANGVASITTSIHTSRDNSWVFSGVVDTLTGSWTPNSSQTETSDMSAIGTSFASGYKTVTTAGATSIQWTNTSTQAKAQALASWEPYYIPTIEQDSSQPITRIKTLFVGQMTETDLAQSISPVKINTIGQTTETDLAQSITSRKIKEIGQTTETDLAQSIVATKIKSIGQASETDLAQSLASSKVKTVDQTSETDLAQAISINPIRRLIGIVTETDLAQPISVVSGGIVAQASETDLAQTIVVVRTKAIGQSSETDLSQAIDKKKGKTIEQAIETDIAQQLVENPNNVYVSGVLENDTAQSVSINPVYRLITQSLETDLGQSITRVKSKTIGQAIETDLAQAITGSKVKSIAQTIGTELAQPIVANKTLSIGISTEVSSVTALTCLKTVHVHMAPGAIPPDYFWFDFDRDDLYDGSLSTNYHYPTRDAAIYSNNIYTFYGDSSNISRSNINGRKVLEFLEEPAGSYAEIKWQRDIGDQLSAPAEFIWVGQITSIPDEAIGYMSPENGYDYPAIVAYKIGSTHYWAIITGYYDDVSDGRMRLTSVPVDTDIHVYSFRVDGPNTYLYIDGVVAPWYDGLVWADNGTTVDWTTNMPLGINQGWDGENWGNPNSYINNEAGWSNYWNNAATFYGFDNTDMISPAGWVGQVGITSILSDQERIELSNGLLKVYLSRDIANQITSHKIVNIGQVVETDLSQDIVSNPRRRLVSSAEETDQAQAITNNPKIRIISLAIEIDSADVIAPTSGVSGAGETDSSISITRIKTKTIGQISETNVSQTIVGIKTKTVGQTSITDIAQPIAPNKSKAIGQSQETDSVFAISHAKSSGVSIAIESDISGVIVPRKTMELSGAQESDLSGPVGVIKSYVLAIAEEFNIAFVVAKRKVKAIGQSYETSLAQVITRYSPDFISVIMSILDYDIDLSAQEQIPITTMATSAMDTDESILDHGINLIVDDFDIQSIINDSDIELQIMQ